MVQLSLPANSRVGTGKTWPKHGDSKTQTEFRIYRWNPDDSAKSAHRHLFRRSQ